MPEPAIPETQRDRDAWTRLWAIVRSAWDRTQDLADALLVSRSAVANWATGQERGSWAALRGALRESARQRPESVPRLAEALIFELLDVRGRFIPEGAVEHRSVVEEAGDVTVALGKLLEAAGRNAPPAEIAELGRAVVREAEEVAGAARRGAS